MNAFELLMVAGMMLVTFGVRYPVLALVSKLPMPERLLNALKFIPPAVLAAIVAPAVFMPNGTLDLHFSNAYLIAGSVSALIAWRTRNLLLTIVLGMVVFLGWRLLF